MGSHQGSGQKWQKLALHGCLWLLSGEEHGAGVGWAGRKQRNAVGKPLTAAAWGEGEGLQVAAGLSHPRSFFGIQHRARQRPSAQ